MRNNYLLKDSVNTGMSVKPGRGLVTGLFSASTQGNKPDTCS